MLTSLYLMRDLHVMGTRVRTPTMQMGRLGVMMKEKTCRRGQKGECRIRWNSRGAMWLQGMVAVHSCNVPAVVRGVPAGGG